MGQEESLVAPIAWPTATPWKCGSSGRACSLGGSKLIPIKYQDWPDRWTVFRVLQILARYMEASVFISVLDLASTPSSVERSYSS